MEQNTEPNTIYQLDGSHTNGAKENIPGWGMDADPDNDPTYPMKKRTGADYERINYEKPPQQPLDIEVLHSNERPGVTRVFGTSTPPKGLSGMIRRYAFRFSEATTAHWMSLLLADRVNVVEGVVEDLMHGTLPNIFAEKGWQAEWKYNRKGFVQKAAVATAFTVGLVVFFNMSSKRKARLKED
jgi:hypothetical protein